IFPILGALAFMAPLYYTYKDRSPDPVGYANWIAIVWLVIGILLTIWMAMRRPQALENAKRIFVEDETVAAPAPTPAGQERWPPPHRKPFPAPRSSGRSAPTSSPCSRSSRARSCVSRRTTA